MLSKSQKSEGFNCTAPEREVSPGDTLILRELNKSLQITQTNFLPKSIKYFIICRLRTFQYKTKMEARNRNWNCVIRKHQWHVTERGGGGDSDVLNIASNSGTFYECNF